MRKTSNKWSPNFPAEMGPPLSATLKSRKTPGGGGPAPALRQNLSYGKWAFKAFHKFTQKFHFVDVQYKALMCIYIYIFTRRPGRSPTLKHTPCAVSVLFAVTAFWRLGFFFWTKCYGMDCFGTYFTHVQTCDVTRVQSATEWTASVHTLHMSKPVM